MNSPNFPYFNAYAPPPLKSTTSTIPNTHPPSPASYHQHRSSPAGLTSFYLVLSASSESGLCAHE